MKKEYFDILFELMPDPVDLDKNSVKELVELFHQKTNENKIFCRKVVKDFISLLSDEYQYFIDNHEHYSEFAKYALIDLKRKYPDGIPSSVIKKTHDWIDRANNPVEKNKRIYYFLMIHKECKIIQA